MADNTVNEVNVKLKFDVEGDSKIGKAQKKLDNLKQTASKSTGAGGIKEIGDSAKKSSSDLETLKSKLNAIKSTKGFSAVTKSLSTIGKGFGAIGKAGFAVAGSPLLAVKKAFNGIKASAGNLFKMFKKRALYRLLNSIISGITNGFKVGLKNAYDYAVATGNQLASSLDSIATSALYVKNSLGAMTAPIVNALAPAIDWLADKFVNLLNIINQVIARLTGASTWLKAIKYPTQFGDAAKDASGKAKELKKTILGLDEINPLTDNKNNSGSGGTTAQDVTKMFEEVPLGKLQTKMSDLFKPFKKAWDNQGKPTMDSFKTALSGILGLGDSISNSVLTVWQNGTGQTTIENILGIVQGISNTIGNITKSVKDGWDKDGNGTKIIQNVWNILNDILGFVKDIWQSTANWAENVNFAPLLESLGKITGAFEPIVQTVGGALKDAYDKVLLPLGQWTIEKGTPKTLDLLSAALELLNKVLTPCKDALSDFWDIFEPAIEFMGDIAIADIEDLTTKIEELSDALGDTSTSWETFKEKVGTATDKIKKYSSPAINGFKDSFSNLSTTISSKSPTIANMINKIKDTVETLKGKVKDLKDNATPLWGDWGKKLDNFWKKCEPIFNNIVKIGLLPVTSAIDGAASAFSVLVDLWEGGVSVICDLISGDTKQAATDFKTTWKNAFDDIIKHFETWTNRFIDVINAIIDTINKIGKLDIKKIARVNWTVDTGKKPQVNKKNKQMQTFASGGTPEMGTMFYAGEAGAEVVANVGNKTGVMNVEQLSAGVEQGVLYANESQNALLREQNTLLRAILNKNYGAGNTSGVDFISAAQQKNRRDGKTIIPVGV